MGKKSKLINLLKIADFLLVPTSYRRFSKKLKEKGVSIDQCTIKILEWERVCSYAGLAYVITPYLN